MSIRLLDRYVWRQLGELFTFGVGIFTLLILVNHLFLVARLVLQQGAALSVALQLLIYLCRIFSPSAFPWRCSWRRCWRLGVSATARRSRRCGPAVSAWPASRRPSLPQSS